MKKDVLRGEKEEARLQGEIQELEKGREDSEERSLQMQRMEDMERELGTLNEELARFAEFDIDEMSKLKDHTGSIKLAVNRWVDNIFNLQSWANRNFGMEKKDFDSQFGIPDELDYPE